MQNRIRTLRTKKNLTQRQLAEQAGTSQQQLQRIEAGKQAARYDIAMKICAALGAASMEEVFPETKMPLAKARKSSDYRLALLNDPELSDALANGGVEADIMERGIKYLFRNGLTGSYTFSAQENRRLFSSIQRTNPDDRFVVFDTSTHRVAINLDHLVFSQFLFDPPDDSAENEEAEDSTIISVYTTVGTEPLTFGVEPDCVNLGENPEAEEEAQLQHFFFDLELFPEPNQLVSFEDEDGERAFFRVDEVVMVTAPLWLLGTSLEEVEEEM